MVNHGAPWASGSLSSAAQVPHGRVANPIGSLVRKLYSSGPQAKAAVNSQHLAGHVGSIIAG